MASSEPPALSDALPWHVINPDSWNVRAETEPFPKLPGLPHTSETCLEERQEVPSASSGTTSAIGKGVQRAMQQAHTDDSNAGQSAEQFEEPPGAKNQGRPARIKNHTKNTQTVRSSASFNSPWIIERKNDGRNVPNEDIERSRVFELYKLHAVRHEVNEGDTLVIVDYPPPPARASLRLDCFGTAYNSQQFRVHSDKLLATGSSVFTEMLGPTRQFRVLRRRKLVNKLPEGVKYVLDLTPPQEGDDLVMAMTELSLTPGIVKWWMADVLHGIDSCLINGHDDICTCMREKHGTAEVQIEPREISEAPEQGSNLPRRNSRFKDPPNAAKLALLKETGAGLDFEVPHYRKIPDYCPFRHCNSIIRLLMFIEGHNIILDSASRVWTLLGIAKLLDCQLILRDKVTQWLMYSVNARFIEILPEEALKIGFALELPDITQCAFRILVNELAIELAATPATNTTKDSGVTVFGRKKGDAGDELNNLIQHAARAFCERVETQMKALETGFVGENLDIAEWQRLRELESCLAASDHPLAQTTVMKVRKLMLMLDREFKDALEKISRGLQTHHESAYQSIDNDRATYVEPVDWQPIEDAMYGFNALQRRLCAFFYHDLTYLCQGLLSNQGGGPYRSGIGEALGNTCSDIQADLEKLEAEVPTILPDKISAPHPVSSQRFTPLLLHMFRNELDIAIMPIAYWWHRNNIDPPLNITRHLLLTLGPNELKFLPLWAGGNDDGTGGVFESAVPSAELGPNGPGPAYHTGITIPSEASSVSGSLMEEIRNMNVRGSTTAGSIDVHDSISTVYRPDHVIADDRSIATESFDTSESGAYAEARYFEPAEHQPTGKALEMLVDGGTSTNGSVAEGPNSETSARVFPADYWEVVDGSDTGSDTLSDSSMEMF